MMPQAHRNPTSTSFRKSIRTDNGGSSEDIRDTFNVGLCLRHITYTHFRRLCEITHQIEIPPRRTNNHRIFSRALNKGLRIDGPIRTFCPSLACIFREKNNYNCTSRFPLRFVFPIHLIPANCKKKKKKKKTLAQQRHPPSASPTANKEQTQSPYSVSDKEGRAARNTTFPCMNAQLHCN